LVEEYALDIDALMTDENLNGLPKVFAELGLLRDDGGKRAFNVSGVPLAEVVRMIDERARYGEQATGKYLAEAFAAAPFGWDFDAIRLLVLSLLRAGAIDAAHKGQTIDNALSVAAKDCFNNNQAFRVASFRPRKGIDFGVLAEAADHFKASYSVWLYIHAFNKDTLFRVQNEYMAPKLRDERQQLDRLRAEAGTTPSAAQSRAVEVQTTFVDELSSMLEEARRVASLWDPDLDDGVILNFAPLWRLVPQNRVWQKECRTAWEALVKGDYDWAHIAMRLWPERVIPKCAKDRSLAIAHHLDDVFWVEGADGKWTARKAPTRPVDELIIERTSPAVKAALASLLEAPEPLAGTSRQSRKAS